ncbi:hypothetical protein [Rhodococcus sp. AQ5-07]|uniref:hypothetical protein n=1 Tax=Rhodococcus sp. AQ5-07 TaxID=2054902 RepID=UPI0012B583A8|nr:hypothetical protein [Rhodococcus sp. AQ5-07]
MCKPKPGPRCTRYIRVRLENAAVRGDVARTALEENPSHARLQRRVATAEAAYRDTLEVYDSTPGGQNELRAAMTVEPEPDRRAELTRRLTAGEQLRAEQTEALRRIQGGVDNDNERNKRGTRWTNR